MVATKKPNVPQPPPLASRHNSAQPLVRSSKQKDPSPLNANVSTNNVPPKAPQKKPNSTPSESSKNKKKQTKKTQARRKSKFGLLDTISTLLLSIFIIYTVVVCPTDHTLSSPVCMSMAQYKARVLDPYVVPPIAKAFRHPAIAPYTAQVVQATEKVSPYIRAIHSRSTPYIRKYTALIVDRTARPAFYRVFLPNYRQHIQPHLASIYSRIEPYTTPIQRLTATFISKSAQGAQYTYTIAKPYVLRTYEAAKPFALRIYATIRPHAINIYNSGKIQLVQVYRKSYPYARLLYKRVSHRLRKFTRKVGVMRAQYVDKHVRNIWDKVQELSGTSKQKSASSAGLSKTSSRVAAPTKATSLDSTTATKDAQLNSTIRITPENDSSPVPLSPSDNISPSATSAEEVSTPPSSSSAPLLSTSSASPSITSDPPSPSSNGVPSAEQPLSQLSSASSIAASSASSSVLEDIPASASSLSSLTEEATSHAASLSPSSSPNTISSTSALDESIGPLSSASSILASSAYPSLAKEAEASASSVSAKFKAPAKQVPEEQDLDDDFISSLGLEEDEESEVVDSFEPISTPSLTPEQLKEKLRLITADKRRDITTRHEKWAAKLEDLIANKTKEVWDFLVNTRTLAAAAVENKGEVDVDSELASLFSDDDLASMNYVDNERASTLMEQFSSECEKLFKGLDAYLRKETKALSNGPAKGKHELETRLGKWGKVVEKVEERLAGLVENVRGKVRRWYIAVRDIEIDECLAIGHKVKELAESAQADLGLDYAWLDDVTHLDWQKYHDLIRAYERFDDYVRLIQNGTHSQSPPDPVMKALNKLEAEMVDVIRDVSARIKDLDTKARKEVYTLPDEDVKPKPADPEVSILPIVDEDSGDAREYDASQVVITKYKKQVEEALKDIPVEPVREHVEL